MEQEMKRISDVVSDDLQGEKMDICDLVDKEIIVHRIIEMNTEYGVCLAVQISVMDEFEEAWFFTQGVVVARKLREAAKLDAFPLRAVITKTHAYYEIS